ncbi:outer membrane protein assembly factor BamB family protein [Kitasatospora sp. NPDC004240]
MGRYRIVARLGAGGMGRVFLGRSAGGRSVAVKVVREELAEDPAFRRRFAREVDAARRVTGIFTAPVVDAGTDDATPWLATAYVPGLSLAQAVQEHGVWPEHSVLILGAGLAEALEAIHRVGLVHRDLKPSNVLLAADGPRVIDFGISVAEDSTVLTQTGVALGTPGFMSPEQLTGREVGPPSDVFSLGSVLAYTALGTGPFGSGSAQALNFRVAYEEPDLSGLPHSLSAICRCLAKDPARRPTPAALLGLFTRALEEHTEGAGPAQALAAWLPASLAEAVSAVGTGAPATPAPAPAVPLPTPTAPATVRAVPAARPPGDPDAVTESSTSVADDFNDTDDTDDSDGTGAPDSAGPPRRRVVRLLLVAGLTGLGLTLWDLVKARWGPFSFLRAGREARWKYTSYGAALAFPVVAGTTVYAGREDGYLCAVNTATGRERWRFRTAVSGEVRLRTFVAATVVDGTAYVVDDDGRLTALDAETGEARWATPVSGSEDKAPVVTDGTAYVIGYPGTVRALDTATGTQRWNLKERSGIGGVEHVTVSGATLLASGKAMVQAVDLVTGRVRWTFDSGPLSAAPTVADGAVYAPTGNHKLYVLDLATGAKRWTYDAGDGTGVPVVAVGGSAHLCLRSGLQVLDTQTGALRWKTEVRAVAPPTVAGGTVFVPAWSTLHALDAATGKEKWTFEGTSMNSAPAVDGRTLYLTDGDIEHETGTLYAIDTD